MVHDREVVTPFATHSRFVDWVHRLVGQSARPIQIILFMGEVDCLMLKGNIKEMEAQSLFFRSS